MMRAMVCEEFGEKFVMKRSGIKGQVNVVCHESECSLQDEEQRC